MHIGVLTGGGDVPGLNPCIRSITLSALQKGWQVTGLKRGWQGLLEIDADAPESIARSALPLDFERVRVIDVLGGTILHSSRVDPRLSASGDRTEDVLKVLDGLGIDALRTTCVSHERIGVVELFGRRSGETALLFGFLSQADRTEIAEVPADLDVLLPLLLDDKRRNPQGYAISMISEGATIAGEQSADEMSEPASRRINFNVGKRLAQAIEAQLGQGTIVQEIAYLMRAGEPDAVDRMVGFAFGTYAAQLIEEGRTGTMGCLQDGKYASVPAGTLLEGTRRVNVPGLYDPAQYRANLLKVEGMPMFVY